MDAPKSAVEFRDERKLRILEERYAHELMGEDERLEVRERIVRLHRKLDL